MLQEYEVTPEDARQATALAASIPWVSVSYKVPGADSPLRQIFGTGYTMKQIFLNCGQSKLRLEAEEWVRMRG